jgi:hypothetical protein
MIIHVKFIRVEGKKGSSPSEYGPSRLQSFLYDHTKIVEHEEDVTGHFIATLRTEAVTDERAQYYADYQAGRLRSGLIQAKVYNTLQDMADFYVSPFA